MLKIEKNKVGDVFISGDQTDLLDLKRQIDEVIDHQTAFTKTYSDFRWNAHEKRDKCIHVVVTMR